MITFADLKLLNILNRNSQDFKAKGILCINAKNVAKTSPKLSWRQ